MKRTIFDLMDAYGDPKLELNTKTPLSSERIKVLTMNKINSSKSTRRQPILRALIVAAIVVAMSISAFAAENGAAWFREFWRSYGKTELSDEQIALIEKTSTFVGLSQTVDEYTIHVDSVMNDERKVYVKLELYAPEDVVLPYGEDRFFEEISLYNSAGAEISCGWAYEEVIDADKTNNHVEMLLCIQIEEDADIDFLFSDGATLELDTLYKEYGRYFSRRTEVLADGMWSFVLKFTTGEDDLWVHELINEPVFCVMEKNATGEQTTISFTSICLRTLTIDAVYDYPDGADLAALDWLGTKIVKKDGSSIDIFPSSGEVCPDGDKITGYVTFTVDAPIVLSEVAYLEFPGSVQVFVNTES